MAASSVLTASAKDSDLFGHPRGLTFLFTTEMWERFSYYGMRALLVLYMVKYAFLPDHVQDIIGFAWLKAGFEALFGPLDIQPLSSQVYGLYTGLVYFTPILGGLLADRVLGQRRTVVIGAALMAVGHFMMAFESLFLLALLVLILGNGAFKPNITTQVGSLYAPGDPRRDRAFSIFYVGINLGAFLAPLICGTLGETLGWHYGFGAAGIGMTIGLAVYLFASRTLPPDERSRALASGDLQPFGRDEWHAMGALVLLALPVTFFWATYEQQGNTIALWADSHTDRTINLLFWSGQIPVTWFQAFNPFMIFAFTPFVLALWRWQAARRHEPSTIAKMAYGCFGVTLANLVLFAAAITAGGGKASWLWLAVYFVVITVGELYLSPTGLSLVTKVAPARAVSMMMGVWLATSFTGNLAAGYLGSLWSSMDKSAFFLMIAAIAAAAGVTILAFVRPLKASSKASLRRPLGRKVPADHFAGENSTVKIVDLSRELYHRTPSYPGQPPIIHGVWKTHEEAFADSGNIQGNSVMFFSMPDHGGTHIDAPRHFGIVGTPINEYPLENCIVPGICIDLRHIAPKAEITPEDLDAAVKRAGVPVPNKGTVLLCTGHHERTFPNKEYSTDNPGVNVAATEWLAKQGVVHFGIDSMRPGPDGVVNSLVHKACLELDITHIESLCNLEALLGKGQFTFIGLPMKWRGGTGSPIRAVAVFDM